MFALQWGVVVGHYTELYGKTHDYTDQLRALERATKAKSDDPALHFLTGYQYAYLGFTDRAIEQLDQATRLAPRDEMSKQLRDHGSFIPGLRPGPRTAEYLETVMERITYVGAAFLAVIAVAPMVINRSLNIPYSVTQFLGGTGLLIVVSVVLDFIQRVEANLLMRNYAGFLGTDESGGGGRTAA